MNKTELRGIKEICYEIDLIIEGKNNRDDYRYIRVELNSVLTKKMILSDISLVCETIIKIAKTKSRILRHLEHDFWWFINSIPFHMIVLQKIDISIEELSSNVANNITDKSILSRLIGLVQEVMNLKDDHSKGSELRRSSSLKLVGELMDYYPIPMAKGLFLESINSKNPKEQFTALEGLENHYSLLDDEIDDDLIDALEDIFSETDDRTVASTCLQIQINASIMDEMSALCILDDWKDEHRF